MTASPTAVTSFATFAIAATMRRPPAHRLLGRSDGFEGLLPPILDEPFLPDDEAPS